MSIVRDTANAQIPGFKFDTRSSGPSYEHQLSTRLYKRYPSDMIDENGRSVSNPPAVFATQSLEEELSAVADNKSSRLSFAERLSTAKSAMGPCSSATLFGFSLSIASSRSGISNSISMRSPSFQLRCNARNFPGSTELSAPRPFTETVVLAPAQAGMRTYKVNDSGLSEIE